MNGILIDYHLWDFEYITWNDYVNVYKNSNKIDHQSCKCFKLQNLQECQKFGGIIFHYGRQIEMIPVMKFKTLISISMVILINIIINC